MKYNLVDKGVILTQCFGDYVKDLEVSSRELQLAVNNLSRECEGFERKHNDLASTFDNYQRIYSSLRKL